RVRVVGIRLLWEILVLVTGLLFVFCSVLHPWYVSWLLLLVPLTPRRSVLYWSAAVVLTYTAYSSKPVVERAWALWLEYVPFFLFWFQELGTRLKFSLRRVEIVLQPVPPTSEAA
ncbi:MAG: hypothetical protein HY652_13745, partial [Acidobacteria bacterium]|nr:hypothetical protein [Acidobacteriota bacterium]